MESPEAFANLLRPWFLSIGLPELLWPVLYKKLKDDVLDAGTTFAIAELDEADDDEESGGDADSGQQVPGTRVLVATQDVAPAQDVWLIDHAWTFKYRDAHAQLCNDAALRQRLAAMLSLPAAHNDAPVTSSTCASDAVSDGAAPPLQATTVSRDAQAIFELLWKLAGSYRPAQGERTLQEMNDADHDSIWYIMDEVGSAISKCAVGVDDGNSAPSSSSANVKVATMPVCFPEKGCVFSIFWVCEPIEASGMCVAAGTYAVGGNPQRPDAPADMKRSAAVGSALLFGDLLEVATADICIGDASDPMDDDDQDEPQEAGNALWHQCKQSFVDRATAMLSLSIATSEASSSTPSPAAASDKCYPPLDTPDALAPLGLSFPIPFYTDSNLVVSAVTDTEHFRLVAVPEEAKVMWMAHYAMHRTDEFPHAAFVSQMPEERFFTNKRELAAIVKQRLGFRPWFQVTYDAVRELDAFVADFVLRDAVVNAKSIRDTTAATSAPVSPELLRSNDGTNLWIAKPCNLARSIDMTVSNNLQWLLRAAETGPKIFCKYIANPATLRGRKFDLRFVVAVRSLHTVETCLEAYLYNVFWTRFASEQYSLDGFDVYAKHWTVMNYADPNKLLQLHYDAFIPEFNAEYERKLNGLATPWETMVAPKIRVMLRELLEALVPDDVPHNRFRGSYGIDVMLREEVDPSTGALINLEPVLLEVTFSPDCVRAVKYHPSFFNDVFQTLFLGVPSNMTRI